MVRVRAPKDEDVAMTGSPRYVLATPVKAGRDDDFETFMREVVVPADARARPHLVGKWQLLRPAADRPEGCTRAWLMFFQGPADLDDWNLEPLFDEAYGVDASREHMQYFEDMVDGEQTVYALGGEIAL
jgi:hypothetical protein